MSLAEMKLKVIEKVAALEDEQFVLEVLRKIEANGVEKNGQVFDVEEFYSRVKAQYGEVLQRLAQ